jgi:CRP-like cAMP-binding protein
MEPTLGAQPFFADFDPSVLDALAPCAAAKTFRKGELLLREDDAATQFLLLESGAASLEVHSPGSPPVRVEVVRAGEVVGLSWLFPPWTIQLDAKALEPVRAHVFDAPRVRALMQARDDVGYALTRRFLRVLFERLERVRLQRLDVYKSPNEGRAG